MQYNPLIGDWTSEVWHAHGTQCLCISIDNPHPNAKWALKFYHPRRYRQHVRWTPGMGPDYTPVTIIRQESV